MLGPMTVKYNNNNICMQRFKNKSPYMNLRFKNVSVLGHEVCKIKIH